tara:strand:+ start:1282 stop:1923 length:642 start_codon:yes stop_codon:yes gene_type:complete
LVKKSQAIVIKSFPYGNSSLISRLILEDGQKLSIIVKGAKNIKNNKSIIFQSTNLINITYYYRESREIQIHKESELINNFYHIKKSFNSLKYALCVVDIIDKATPKNYNDINMYDITLQSLNKIEFKENYKIIFILFLIAFSYHNGYTINSFSNCHYSVALDLLKRENNENDISHFGNFFQSLDIDETIRTILMEIRNNISEISKVKSLKFIN